MSVGKVNVFCDAPVAACAVVTNPVMASDVNPGTPQPFKFTVVVI